MNERNLFVAALRQPDVQSREAFLIEACGDNAALRENVEGLLREHNELGSFLEAPAVDIEITVARNSSAERPGTTIGPYKLLEQIGEGGMGLVFMAEQTEPVRRKVALKILKPGMDTRHVVARFEAERQALAIMDHPNIAHVFDGGATPTGRPYFVMELVRGVPITEFCDQRRFTTRQRLELFVTVCHAVQHAHQKGIIHRDLKPSNILVTLHDVVAVPKIIDFGIAKATTQPLTDRSLFTHFSQMIGTPLYMSPEQAEMNGLDVDTRSDVYALGVLLYELLTGTTPFASERLKTIGFDEMRRVIREEEPPRPSQRVSTLGAAARSTLSEQRGTDVRTFDSMLRGELDWIVMKSLEKDRNRRYESASAFAADIERYLNDEPVEACPPSLRYRIGKFVRKHRRSLLSAALAAGAVIVLAVVIGFSLAERANRLSKVEQQAREALAGARTAVEAGELTLAQQRVAEALGALGGDRERLHALAADVDRLQREIKDRQNDEARMRQFIQLASDAQDRMSRTSALGGDKIAQDALALYGVLDDDRWFSRLDDSYLTPDQKTKIRETAYITLVSLADWCVRWRSSSGEDRAERALRLLTRAETFHAPTRAFYFVRSRCHKDDKVAARQDEERFQTTAAISPWDHYLPGHTAGENDDPHEAIRCYRAALDLQPDHFNSLFFLGLRLHRLGRDAEAIAYFRACEVLRPDDITPFFNRLTCYVASSQFEELEAQEVVLLQKYRSSQEIDSKNRTFWQLRHLLEHYERAGKFDAIDRLGPQLIQLQRRANGPPSGHLFGTLGSFGGMLLSQGRYREAEPLLREHFAMDLEWGSERWERFYSQSKLGEALLGQSKYAEAEEHLLEAYRGMKAHVAAIPSEFRTVCEREVEDRVLRLYDRWEKKDKAEHWRAELRDSYIRSWLILSESLPLDLKEPGQVLDRQQIAGEAGLRPRSDDPIQVGDRNLIWKELHSADKYIDLRHAYSTDQARIAYMVCYLHADDDVSAMLSVAQDDSAKVYLNGQEVYRGLEWRELSLETTPIALKKGSNALVVKVINNGGSWGGIVRVWRTDGLPTKGIEFRLTP